LVTLNRSHSAWNISGFSEIEPGQPLDLGLFSCTDVIMSRNVIVSQPIRRAETSWRNSQRLLTPNPDIGLMARKSVASPEH